MRCTLVVDGARRDCDLEPARTLADVLDPAGLQRNCTDGTCGACTVLVDGESTRSCLMFAVQCDGAQVITGSAATTER